VAHWHVAARPNARALFDVAITAASFAGSLALLSRTGFSPVGARSSEFPVIGMLLAAGSTLPLIAWRRFPLGAFVVTATAGVVLAGLGYRVDPLVAPAAALYLLAASRPNEQPWTWRITATIVGLFLAYLGGTAVAQGTLPRLAFEHTALGWGIAWFAG